MKNRIARLRKEGRITQEELAEAVGVTRQTIISLENGRYNASLLLAHKLAQYQGQNHNGRGAAHNQSNHKSASFVLLGKLYHRNLKSPMEE